MDAVELLRGLVATPSLSGNEAAASRYLRDAMQALGFDAHVDAAGNAVGVRETPGNGPLREIVLLGHIDTVPGEIPVRVVDGVLHGRGSVDAKGPLATFVMAAARAALPPATRLVVVGAVEEESATSKGARHVLGAFRPDGCIIGEPSGWDAVTLGYKGRLLVDYDRRQAAGHSARFSGAVAEAAFQWWQGVLDYVNKFNRDRPTLFEQLIPGLRDVHTASDGLCDRVTATVGLRLPPGFDAAACLADLRTLDPAAAIRGYAHEPAFRGDRRSGLVRAFNVAIRAHGARATHKLKTGTSDMNVVGPIWGCPILAYGPGDSSLDHTPQERLDLAEYERAIAVLQQVLESPLSRRMHAQGRGLG